jgi:hypothetical protein
LVEANRAAIDHQLGHAPAAGQRLQLPAALEVAAEVDLLESNPAALEVRSRTVGLGVDGAV